MTENLKIKLENLPPSPGVYQFFDKEGVLLYVGKAKKLKNRVRSYFQDSRPHDGRLRAMVSRVFDLEIIVTDSEAEALMLENNLIKQHQPRYNINLKDDKTYPYICITRGERPRIFPTRTAQFDGLKYFGPYDSVVMMRRMLELIAESFGLCSCACSIKNIDPGRGLPKWRTCFNAYLGKCSAEWPDDVYRDSIQKAEKLLQGKTNGLIRELKEEMLLAAQALAFEDAARLRDGIEVLERFSEKMKMVVGEPVDRDVFAIESLQEENAAAGVMLKIREGKVIGRFHRILKNVEGLEKSVLLEGFMEEYYTGPAAIDFPEEVFLDTALPEDELLSEYLAAKNGRKVIFTVAKIGDKAQLIRLAQQNARQLLNDFVLARMKAEGERIPHAVKALQRDLRLKRLPRRIECFDNSNLQGTDAVSSMVCFVDGRPRKSEYKRFMVKTVEGPDDFETMKEVIKRRYNRVMAEGLHIPDLIVVDGGKGQLSHAVEALKEIGFYGQVPIIGLAKRLEEVFFPGDSEATMIPKTSSSLKLLQQVRDEAHRFAITFHRERRSKRTITTELVNIEGIGKTTAETLLKTFGSVKGVLEASDEELTKVVGAKRTAAIRAWFEGTLKSPEA
jgi:excinuclease ABC subunit C